MNKVFFLLLGAILPMVMPAHAENPPSIRAERIEAPEKTAAISLYSDTATGELPERWSRMPDGQRVVRNVSQPTLTPVLPTPARATGAGVVVVPGGGFKFVAMDNEGWPIAEWLADHGIAAFVLKYRTNETPDDDTQAFNEIRQLVDKAVHSGELWDMEEPRAILDALAALKMVRANAGQWHIDPERVGMIGFSAGALTTLKAALAASDRPAFFGAIYGPMTAVSVGPDAPPMFVALALDDELFGGQGFDIVDAWRKAGRPVELHAYEGGRHGFGRGRPGTTSTLMLPQFLAWMESRGLLKTAGRPRE